MKCWRRGCAGSERRRYCNDIACLPCFSFYGCTSSFPVVCILYALVHTKVLLRPHLAVFVLFRQNYPTLASLLNLSLYSKSGLHSGTPSRVSHPKVLYQSHCPRLEARTMGISTSRSQIAPNSPCFRRNLFTSLSNWRFFQGK